MDRPRNIAELIKEKKTVFIIIAVVLFLIELEIFAIAAIKSGRKSWIQVLDDQGNLIHETDGKKLDDFDKYYFERTFGRSLDQYQIKLITQDKPFPFRAWFVAAVGIPLGLILLYSFVVKAYVFLLYGDELKKPAETGDETSSNGKESQNSFERFVNTISSFNIFAIGFLVLSGVLAYWIFPNMITHLGKIGVETLIRFKWVFISAAIVLAGIFMWVIYLKYLLAKKDIDSRTELSKFKMQLEMKRNPQIPLELEDLRNSDETLLVTYEKNEKKT